MIREGAEGEEFDEDEEFNVDVDDDGFVENESHEIENMQRNAIALGVGINALSQIFDKPPIEIKKAVAKVKPKGYRGKKPIYELSEAAQYLVNPVVDIAEFLKNLKPSDIPHQLSRDYWQGQLNRQKYEAAAGHYWKTERVQAVLAKILGLVRQQVMLFTDSIEQQTALETAQRKLLVDMCDGLLQDMGDTLRTEFAFYEEQDRDELLNLGELQFDEKGASKK